jgi:hypothetical protein
MMHTFRHAMTRLLLFSSLALTAWGSALAGEPLDAKHVPKVAPGAVVPLPRAHAHNDYAHQRPLLDALDCGFCSIEADVYLDGGELLVGHTRSDLRKERTLKTLYLEPLRQRIEQNAGRVYRDGPEVWLLIDFKSDGAATLPVLQEQLEPYRAWLSSVKGEQLTPRAVRVVISGNCPRQAILAQHDRLYAIDGRPADLQNPLSAAAMPLISAAWSREFTWRGKGEMPEAERTKLQDYVAKAHRAGCRLRFWNTPHDENLWRTLVECDVDFLNADDLARLRDFLRR